MMAESDHTPKPPVRPFAASDQGGDSPAELARIAERNRLIVQVMEIDAKQRHLDAMQNGLKLEVNRLSKVPDDKLVGLQAQLRDVEAQLRRLASQREFLSASLAEIDGGIQPEPRPRGGRA